jgi:hypothetical protein
MNDEDTEPRPLETPPEPDVRPQPVAPEPEPTPPAPDNSLLDIQIRHLTDSIPDVRTRKGG